MSTKLVWELLTFLNRNIIPRPIEMTILLTPVEESDCRLVLRWTQVTNRDCGIWTLSVRYGTESDAKEDEYTSLNYWGVDTSTRDINTFHWKFPKDAVDKLTEMISDESYALQCHFKGWTESIREAEQDENK